MGTMVFKEAVPLLRRKRKVLLFNRLLLHPYVAITYMHRENTFDAQSKNGST